MAFFEDFSYSHVDEDKIETVKFLEASKGIVKFVGYTSRSEDYAKNRHFQAKFQSSKAVFSVGQSTGPLFCPMCSYSTPTKSRMRYHQRKHTWKKNYKCSLCNKEFHQKSNLTTHMVIHSGEKPFECPVCKQRFSLKHHLKSHVAVHAGQCHEICRVCGASFRTLARLNQHMKLHSFHKQ